MKKHILGVVEDLTSDFLYYDRKEDDFLTHEKLVESVKNGEVTIEEMGSVFMEAIKKEISKF